MKKGALKKFFNKFWEIVWKDDSLKGWIISMIFLLVVIRLIFFPLLGLVTGTSLPLVIVESCSMHHEKNLFSDYESWFDEKRERYFFYKIQLEDWKSFHFKKGFTKGDILFVTGIKPENIQVGDVIIFNAGYQNPIIHRVIEVNEEDLIFATLGDNNDGQLEVEKKILESQVIGKARARVLPYIGWIKLIFFEGARPSSQRGFC